jgi:hypothetical protein
LFFVLGWSGGTLGHSPEPIAKQLFGRWATDLGERRMSSHCSTGPPKKQSLFCNCRYDLAGDLAFMFRQDRSVSQSSLPSCRYAEFGQAPIGDL